MSDQNQAVVEPGIDPAKAVEPGIDPSVQPKTEPETNPAGELGIDQNQQKTVETPEDIAENRAFYQSMSQKLAEEKNALMDELNAIKGTVNPITVPVAAPAAPITPAVQPAVTPAIDPDEDEVLTTAAFNKMMDAREKARIAADEEAKRVQTHAEAQRLWTEENDRAESTLDQIQKKYKLSDEVVDAAVERAKTTLNLQPQLGLADARLNLVKQDLSNHIVQMRSQGGAAAQLATDQQKVAAAAQLAQPATGVIDPQVQKQKVAAASEISEMDDRYPIV